MRKNVSLVLVLIVLCITLSSCYDASEIDDNLFVTTLGIDIGQYNKVKFTIQYPVYSAGGGGQSGGGGGSSSGEGGGDKNPNQQQGSNIEVIDAPTILEAVDMFGMSLSRRVSLKHAKFVIISEDVARQGLSAYLQAIDRYYETRPTMSVVIVKGKAEDFIRANEPKIGGSLPKTMELLIRQSKYSSFFPRVQLHEFGNDMVSGYVQAVAIYGGINDFKKIGQDSQKSGSLEGSDSGGGDSGNEKKDKSKSMPAGAEKSSDSSSKSGSASGSKPETASSSQPSKTAPPLQVSKGYFPGELPRSGVNERELVGMAVFRGDKLAGFLDSYDTSFYLIATGKFYSGAVTIPDEKDKNKGVVFDIRSNKRKVTINALGDKPEITIKLYIESDIESIQSGINYEDIHMIESLNKQLAGFLKSGIQKMIEKTQKEYKSDAMGLGMFVAGKFLTIPEWENYKWLDKYENAKINLELIVNVRRTGLMIDTAENRR